MALAPLEIWEDSGPVLSGHGTTRQEVDNIGWKDSGLDESFQFVDYPVGRPYTPNKLFSLSYKKYNYLKIQGTYSSIADVQVQFVGNPTDNNSGSGTGKASGVRVYYKWQSVYEEPDNLFLGGSWFDPYDPPTWQPLLSTVGPEGAASYFTDLVDNTTYYTQYLVTQLYVTNGAWDDLGNLSPDFSLYATAEETYTAQYREYDHTLVNWEW